MKFDRVIFVATGLCAPVDGEKRDLVVILQIESLT